jgi:hypothetical protein
LTPDLVFREPYFLDFLGLKDTYSEKDIEDAILRELERFILEIGVGFTFVARQKRIALEDEDCYLDLLFYHRELLRLVAVDLKLEKFKAAHKGQMELYLKRLDRHERQPNEESPLGLILAPANPTAPWSFWNWTKAASTWPRTLRNSPPLSFCAANCGKQLRWQKPGSKAAYCRRRADCAGSHCSWTE